MYRTLAIMSLVAFTTGCMTPMHRVPVRVETNPNATIYANDRLIGSPSDDKPAQIVGIAEVDIHFGADYRTWVNEETGVGYLYTSFDGSHDEVMVARCGENTSPAVTVKRAPRWPGVMDAASRVLIWIPIVGMMMPAAWDVQWQEVKLDPGDCDAEARVDQNNSDD